MLEILLWTIFVVPGTSGSDRVVEAFESTGLQLGEAKGGLPDRYKGNPNKLLSRPLATRTIWCEVATTKLQGDDLQHLVLGCLKGDFQDVSEVIAHTEDLITAYT